MRGRPCGELTTAARCPACQQTWDRERNARRTHYHGDYRRRARQVRLNATECWFCGAGASVGDPWTAHHVKPGDPDSPLVAAHASCNESAGNRC